VQGFEVEGFVAQGVAVENVTKGQGEHVLDPVAVAERGGGWAADGLPGASGVSFHSARVRPGDAFFALPGAAQHGLEFAEAALEAGAAYVVSDRAHPRGVTVPDPAGLLLALGEDARRQMQGIVIGVTGSAGKTSCKAFLGAALGAETTPGNFNTPLALAQVLVAAALAGRTGTDARLVLELGIDHPGEMDTLLALAKPTHAVITLIAPSHLAGLGSVAGVAREKLKLADAAGHAFVSTQAAAFLSAAQRPKVTTYGLDGADVTGTLSDITPSGQTLSALGRASGCPSWGQRSLKTRWRRLRSPRTWAMTPARRLSGWRERASRPVVCRFISWAR
jgi:UDP-N-acetylmuramoyl-tripeptide--D-alanyl-D-alanine ligase